MAETIISVKNLTKVFKTKTKEQGLKGSFKSLYKPTYKQITAVDNINIDVYRGEMLAFLGPNGAGKSTTIKMMTGILFPTSGEMSILGYDPRKDRKKLSFRIGTVFGQKSQLWFHLPPADSFRLLGAIYEVDDDILKKRVNELVDIFEINEFFDIPIRKLSLGQRIRCEIAASLIHKPEILFLDEPTIGLDVVVKQKIRELIKRLNKEDDTTIFLTSHDMGDVEKLCSRAVIINSGSVVLDTPLNELKYNYLNRKIVDIKYTDKVDVTMHGIKVIKQNGYSVKLDIDTDKAAVSDVMEELLKRGSIVDITVSDPPMEEIIASIFEHSRKP